MVRLDLCCHTFNSFMCRSYSPLCCSLDGSDYERIDISLTFSPDNTSLSIPVTVLDDSLLESQESFALRLLDFSDVSTAVFSPAVAEISIIDNDSKYTNQSQYSLLWELKYTILSKT